MIANTLQNKRLILLGIVTLLFTLLMSIILCEGVYLPWNEAILHMARTLQSPLLTNIFLPITYLGESKILLIASVFITLYCLSQKHWRLALYWFFYLLGLSASISLVKHGIHTPRPGGIVSSPAGYSFPSGHVTLAVAFYGFWIFRIAHALHPRFFMPLLSGFAVFVVLVAMSRLYLSAHWLTDVLGSALLGTILLTLVNILYERKTVDNIKPFMTTAVCLLSLIICTTIYGVKHFEIDKQNVQLVALDL